MVNQEIYITSIHRNRLNDSEIEIRGYSEKRFAYTAEHLKSESFSDELNGVSFALKFHNRNIKLSVKDAVWIDLFSFNNGINHNDEIEVLFKESQLLVKRVGFFSQLKSVVKIVAKERRYKEAVFQMSALLYRKYYKNKPIVLFADRIDKANDNAEVLYPEVNDQQVKKFFVLRKDCADYERLKKTYQVIPFGHFKHKMLSLVADYIISSHADQFLLNPFLKDKKSYRGFFHYRFIFLQHGVTKDDMSAWLNREGKDIYYLITSSEREAESFLTGDYNYNHNEIKVTGMPRFDKLNDVNTKRRIVFMPTWRSELAGIINQQTGKYEYNPEFKKSSFFEQINSFLSAPELERMLNETGYEFLFIPHPNLVQQKDDFYASESIKIETENVDYSHLIQTSEILITDYSSVAFDFAYHNKPILYFQFDKGNLVPGYYDYASMGFGPVVEEVPEMIKELSAILSRAAKVNTVKYEKRADDFFMHRDKMNSVRVTKLIQ